jgi:hypothetical protein
MRGGRTQKNNFLFGVGYDKNKLITVVLGTNRRLGSIRS